MKFLAGLLFALLATAAELPVDLAVPSAPVPFRSAGKQYLVYELQIWNYAAGNLTLKRIDVLSDTGTLATWQGGEVAELFYGRQDVLEDGVLRQGLRAVAYLWIELDSTSPVPAHLHHRLTAGDGTVEGAAIAVSTAQPLVIGPPLRGASWIAANGPSNTSPHRRTIVPVEGRARIAQRFATDWIQLGPDGDSASGSPEQNRSYRAYGAEVLAVADATVTEVRNDIPENTPGPSERAVRITTETIGGNHVILDLGDGHFAAYLHMQPGSIRVKPGERVRRGDLLGLIGNSGNSSEPHLHFQVTDAASVLGAEGLPYLIDSFSVTTPQGAVPRSNQLPMRGEIVSFASGRP